MWLTEEKYLTKGADRWKPLNFLAQKVPQTVRVQGGKKRKLARCNLEYWINHKLLLVKFK